MRHPTLVRWKMDGPGEVSTANSCLRMVPRGSPSPLTRGTAAQVSRERWGRWPTSREGRGKGVLGVSGGCIMGLCSTPPAMLSQESALWMLLNRLPSLLQTQQPSLRLMVHGGCGRRAQKAGLSRIHTCALVPPRLAMLSLREGAQMAAET